MYLRGRGTGTILGTLLFLSCINYHPNCLSNCEPRMFAGDIHLTYADSDGNIESCPGEDLLNGLRLNTLTAPPTVSMDGIRVEQV